jgi:hypothetical protein
MGTPIAAEKNWFTPQFTPQPKSQKFPNKKGLALVALTLYVSST